MSGLRIGTRQVWRAPTARRDFLTKRSAARAEAAALIRAKYPTEREDRDGTGMVIDPGWHWSQDDRLVRLHARVVRRLISGARP